MNLKAGALLLLVGSVGLLGCTIDGGRVLEKDKHKVFACKDFRDGESFSFKASEISNVRQGIGAPTTFDVATLDGKKKTLGSNMEGLVKCNEVAHNTK